MKRPLVLVVAILAAGAVVAAAWWLGSPLLLSRTVDEALPTAGTSASALTTGASGEFEGADNFHRGAGIATLLREEDGGWVLRLEDFSVTNGPDLHVLLGTGADPLDKSAMGDTLDLGKLKGNQGSQNYRLPDETDVSRYRSVIIYCQPFHVIFAGARLRS